LKYSESIEGFLGFLREVQTQYNIALQAEKDADDQTQDILHSLEFEENKYHDCARLSLTLSKVRQERRAAKDTRLQLQPIVDWAGQNAKAIKSMEQLLGAVRKAEKNLDGRFYRHKTDIVERTLEDRRLLG
jgi:hypothetical protein